MQETKQRLTFEEIDYDKRQNGKEDTERSSTMSNWRIDWRRCSRIKLVPKMVVRRPPVKSLDSKPGEDHVYRPSG
ncbi:hypothetical protein NL676_026783 [Syzygium grande]|nr:hypothetical protein NL676_026783 [Syzygium grande]